MNTQNRRLRRSLVTGCAVICLLVLAALPAIPSSQQMFNKWMMLSLILEKIERFYIEEKNPEQLLDAALRGILTELDQHSVYLNSDEYSTWKRRYQHQSGIGIKYNRSNGLLTVISLMENGPAARAGVQLGDQITHIKSRSVSSLDNLSIQNLLSQSADTTILLTIERRQSGQVKNIRVPVEPLQPNSIAAAGMLNKETGYIKLLYFHAGTPAELDQAIQSLNQSQMSQLILDLRDNQGGELDAGIEVANRFLPGSRLIAYTKGRSIQANKRYVSTASRSLIPNLPLIVLVNEQTASDAEIVAGAIQDWDRGLIAGQNTFGKALVQTEYPMQDGSALLLTTARFYTPLGRSIQRSDSEQNALTFKTPKGRVLQGAGGIAPDLMLSQSKTALPDNFYQHLQNEGRFWQVADDYVNRHPQLLLLALSNASTFHVPDSLVNAVANRLLAGQRSAKSTEILQRQIIKQALTIEMAGRIWGDQGRYLLMAFQDTWVQKAIANFQQARQLLSNF